MKKTRSLARGFTLIELLMTCAVSSLVIAGMASAFISQARQYQVHANRRAVQSHGRQGLIFMETMLRRAGYGVDPWLAVTPFDSFDRESNAMVANYPDAVTVLARDPNWRRNVNAAGTTTLMLAFTEALEAPLLKGQILLVLGCGAGTFAYVTVATKADIGSFMVRLETAGPAIETPVSGPGARFHEQMSLTNECLDNNEAVIVKVDRYSFFLAAYPEHAGDPRAAWTPYLMLHRGLEQGVENGINAADAVPLVDNVEQLQFSYVLNTDGNTAPVVKGVDPADAAWAWGTSWDVVATRPATKVPYHHASRLTNHPANIRQVRAVIVTRGTNRDFQLPTSSLFTPAHSYASGNFPNGGALAWRQLENLNGALPAPFDPTSAGFIRNAIRLTVTPKNLLMRSQFNPPTAGGG